MDVDAQWINYLGVRLGLKTMLLQRITFEPHDSRDRLLKILKTWLTTSDNTSWKTLTDALRSRSVGASQLAADLQKKYCLVEETEVDESKL